MSVKDGFEEFARASGLSSYGKTINFWGLTPAIDLVNTVACNRCNNGGNASSRNAGGPNELEENHEHSILVIGSGDGRHVLQSLAQRTQQNKPMVRIYVVESHAELLARELLFFSVSLDCWEKLSLLQKTDVLLDIYGNIRIRAETERALVGNARTILSQINCASSSTCGPASLVHLKESEKETIASVIRYWTDEKTFPDMRRMWDERLRSHTGVRYDNRLALYDWDYHMKIPRPICFSPGEYSNWRETGMAFKTVDGRYAVPNKTLCSVDRKTRSGFGDEYSSSQGVSRGVAFRGDIVCSPYIAYSGNSDDATEDHQCQQRNGVKHIQDNLKGLLQTLPSGIPPEKTEIRLITIGRLLRKAQDGAFDDRFDCIYLAHDAIHYLRLLIPRLLRTDGVIVLETMKYLFYYQKEDRERIFDAVVTELGRYGFRPKEKCDPSSDPFCIFLRKA